ncbi:MAG: hypothetical protein CSA32_03400 [Desulfobulbus propionicus]|nr:MAG: hypothetical protein CSA32_03400 [Desulfobulbus propionicus]
MKKYIQTHVRDVSELTQILPECSPEVSSGSTIFGSILAAHIPRYNEVPEITEPGTTWADEKSGLADHACFKVVQA